MGKSSSLTHLTNWKDPPFYSVHQRNGNAFKSELWEIHRNSPTGYIAFQYIFLMTFLQAAWTQRIDPLACYSPCCRVCWETETCRASKLINHDKPYQQIYMYIYIKYICIYIYIYMCVFIYIYIYVLSIYIYILSICIYIYMY